MNGPPEPAPNGPSRRVSPPDFCHASRAQSRDVLSDQRPALCAVVDEERITRATAQSLDAKRAGAGKDIDDLCSLKSKAFEGVMHQDVEYRLAHLIRGRPHAIVGGFDKRTTTKLSAGHPHVSSET